MVRSFIRAVIAAAGPWIRRVPPCRTVRGRSKVWAVAAHASEGEYPTHLNRIAVPQVGTADPALYRGAAPILHGDTLGQVFKASIAQAGDLSVWQTLQALGTLEARVSAGEMNRKVWLRTFTSAMVCSIFGMWQATHSTARRCPRRDACALRWSRRADRSANSGRGTPGT